MREQLGSCWGDALTPKMTDVAEEPFALFSVANDQRGFFFLNYRGPKVPS